MGLSRDLSDIVHEIFFIFCRPLVFICFVIFRAKMIKLCRIYVSTQFGACILYTVAGSTASFTNLSGGNQVHGLPPAVSLAYPAADDS